MPVAVNGLEAARAALAAGERDLISPPFAALHAGVGYYAALLDVLREEFPDADFTFTVCCGDDPAIAHDALRLGIKSIACETTPSMFAKLQAVAQGLDAHCKSAYGIAPETTGNR